MSTKKAFLLTLYMGIISFSILAGHNSLMLMWNYFLISSLTFALLLALYLKFGYCIDKHIEKTKDLDTSSVTQKDINSFMCYDGKNKQNIEFAHLNIKEIINRGIEKLKYREYLEKDEHVVRVAVGSFIVQYWLSNGIDYRRPYSITKNETGYKKELLNDQDLSKFPITKDQKQIIQNFKEVTFI